MSTRPFVIVDHINVNQINLTGFDDNDPVFLLGDMSVKFRVLGCGNIQFLSGEANLTAEEVQGLSEIVCRVQARLRNSVLELES